MRRVSIVFVLSLLAGSLVSAPFTSSAEASSTPARATVQGVIRDAVTNDPIAGACLSLYPYVLPGNSAGAQRLAHACVDGGGNYSIADFPVGASTVAYLEAPGYGHEWYPGRADHLSGLAYFGSVTGPVTTRDVTMMRATAGLSVHLTRQDGSPAAYASAQLVAVGVSSPFGILQADASGNATRTDLPAGDWKIRLSGAGYGIQYYPGKTTVDEGTTVTLVAGSTVSISEQFNAVDPMPAPAETTTQTGKVTGPDGTPIAGATVAALIPSNLYPLGTTTTAADGTYSLSDVLKVGVFLRVSAPGFATVWNTDDPLPTIAYPLTATHDFVLRPGPGTLRGTLTDSVDGPIPYPTSISLTGSGGWTYTGHRVGFDGSFDIPDLPAGNYTVSINASGRPVQAVGVTVNAGQTTTLNTTLTAPALVEVHVLDDVTGQPIAGASVTGTTSETPPTQTVVTDASGVAILNYWQAETVQIGVDHRPNHFTGSTQVTTMVGATTVATVRLKPGAVLRVPVNEEYQYCLYSSAVPRLDIANDLVCAPAQNGFVTFGPLKAGPARAFLDPQSDTLGMQWVSDSGGTGNPLAATILQLTAGQTTTAPAQRIGPAGSIHGRLLDARTHTAVPGCVRPAATTISVPGGNCATAGDAGFTVDKLGPYKWPLQVSPNANWGTVWSGNASNLRDAELVPIGASRDISVPLGAQYRITPPTGGTAVVMWAYDALTGEAAGRMDLVDGCNGCMYTTGSAGAHLLYVTYEKSGSRTGCWMRRPTLAGRKPMNVFIGGTAANPTKIVVKPGVNCLPNRPSLPGGGWVSVQTHLWTNASGRSTTATSATAGNTVAAPSATATFNDLVQSNFDSALQLALAALP